MDFTRRCGARRCSLAVGLTNNNRTLCFSSVTLVGVPSTVFTFWVLDDIALRKRRKSTKLKMAEKTVMVIIFDQ